MIRVSLLGPAELTGESGEPLHAVLAQPRRFGLLAFLAGEGARAARRDELLAMFWPELDEPRARRGLTYAIYFLRRELGSGIIAARRDEVALDPTGTWCDVWAFEEALDDGRLAEALDLYRGDFLAGFFADDAPGLEHWADARRFRLHERARAAAWALVERAAREKSTSAGVRWARRALEIAPDDERALRALLPLLHSLGDTAGLLAEYGHFAREFEELHGSPPSQQTRALADALYGAPVPVIPMRDTAERPASVTARGAPDGEIVGVAVPKELPSIPDPAPMKSAAIPITHSADPAAPAPPRLGRRARIGLGVVAGIAALTTLATWRATGTERAAEATSVVAVMPLAYHGVPELEYTSDGLTSLLVAGIDNLGGLRTVNPRLLTSASASAKATRDPGDASAAARRFGAASFVLGDVTAAGGRLRVTASMYESEARTGRARLVGAAVTVEGPADSLFQLADQLTAGLAATRSARTRPRTAAAALKGTSSLPALRAFLDGERNFRSGRYDAAIVAYRAAVAVDTGFALAFFRMSQAANWTGDFRLQRMADEETQRLRERLPLRERRRAEAWHESMVGRPLTAEALYRDLVAEDPTDVEAWYYLADLVYHWGASALGRPAAESRPEWERVLALEPTDASALIHLARLAAAEGDRAAFDSLTGRLTSLDASSDVAPEVRALRAFAFGNAAARSAVAREFAHVATKLGVVAEVVGHIMATSDDLAGVSSLWAAVEKEPPTQDVRAQIALHRATVAIGRGRLREADALIETASALAPAMVLRYRGLVATLPFIAPRPASMERVRQQLARGDTIASGGDAIGWRYFLLGTVAVRGGNVGEGMRQWVPLDRYAATTVATPWAKELAPVLRAEIAFRSGRPTDALAAIGPRPGVGTLFSDPPSTLASANERWLRAESYAITGRTREALRVFASIPEPTGGDVAFAAAAHLRRAELYESLGEGSTAAMHYRRAEGYWAEADVEFRSLRERARSGLARVAK